MNAQSSRLVDSDISGPVFCDEMRQKFAWQYPEQPHKLAHNLADNPMLELDALAQLAEQLPEASVEYNRGDVPIGVDGKPESTGLSIGETIRKVHEANSWAVLKNVEQAPVYEALLLELPKIMTQFPAGDARFAPDSVHESYHAGGARELTWDDSFKSHGREFPLTAGEALFVPVMAPHFVRNGPQSSISLSITWRSEWSFAEADARGFNRMLRKLGMAPQPPGRFPKSNRGKALAYRALRKAGLAG